MIQVPDSPVLILLPWHIDQRVSPHLQASDHVQMAIQQVFLSPPAQPLLALEVQFSCQLFSLKHTNKKEGKTQDIINHSSFNL